MGDVRGSVISLHGSALGAGTCVWRSQIKQASRYAYFAPQLTRKRGLPH
jgi:hypothetical protein